MVQNITFDYRTGAPKLWNMDGIHIEGGCRNGLIKRLRGACHDDTVAITADDMLWGHIEKIHVEDIRAEGAHSAVRLLSHGLPVRHITVRRICGSCDLSHCHPAAGSRKPDRSAFTRSHSADRSNRRPYAGIG